MKLKGVFVFVLLMLSFAGAHAETLSVAQAQKFLHLSGLQQGIDAMPQQFEQQMNLQRLMAENVIEHEKAGSLVREAVSGIDGQALAINYLTTSSKGDDLKQVLSFLQSDLGKKIVAVENQANEPDFQVSMQQYAHEMATNNSLSTKRLELVQDLIRSLHVEDMMMNMVKGMMFSTADILKTVKPEVAAIMEAQMDEEWQKMEGMLKAQFSQYLVVSTHYIYRDISDQDLSEYMVFLKSKIGQAYWSSSIDIFNQYLGEFIKNFTHLLVAADAS